MAAGAGGKAVRRVAGARPPIPLLGHPVWAETRVSVLVLAVVAAALAVLAVPETLGKGRVAGPETAALATLRALVSAQERFRDSRAVDLDGDGIGEYGTLGELTGAAGLRRSADGSLRGERLRPPVLGPALAGVDVDGIVFRSGYCFRLCLPGAGGPVFEGVPGLPFTAPVDGDRAEERWCAYAWPMASGRSGTRCFYAEERGGILQHANDGVGWQGMTGGIPWDAAFAPGTGWGRAAPGSESRGGGIWKVTN